MTDQSARQLEQPDGNVRAALVARAQPLERVQPGEPALDHPADLAQPGAMRDATAGDAWGDPSCPQEAAVLVEVVATVGEQLARLASRPPAQAADGWDRVQQWQWLGDVVAVATGQGDRERDAVRVDDQVVLGARVAAVDR